MRNTVIGNLKSLTKDIRFWLIFFFAIRLFGITHAPLETGHNWRQSLTNMIARNFVEVRANLLYPMIDMAGEKTGIIGSEFPFFNYLIYLVSEVFGYEHWYGRLINLLVSTVGIYFFYLIVKEIVDRRAAFSSTLLLTLSIWFAYSRKIMPDTFSVALVLIGLYFAISFVKKGGALKLSLFFVMTTLGMLCKIPALALFGLVSLVLLVRGIPLSRKVQLLSASFVGFLIVCAWYFYWVPHLLETYKYQLYFPKGFVEGVKEIIPLWKKLLERFYFNAFYSYAALVCCLAGVVVLLKSQRKLLQLGFALVCLVFAAFIVKTGSVFPLHNYYIIPFVPVMALLGGLFLAKIPAKFQYALLLVIGVESIANQQHDFFIKEEKLYKLGLESAVDQSVPKNSLIIINGGPSPQDIYFAHRKGWTVTNEELSNQSKIDSLAALGAQYIVVDKTFRGEGLNDPNYTELYNGEYYQIVEL
jgi:hypothetical protein